MADRERAGRERADRESAGRESADKERGGRNEEAFLERWFRLKRPQLKRPQLKRPQLKRPRLKRPQLKRPQLKRQGAVEGDALFRPNLPSPNPPSTGRMITDPQALGLIDAIGPSDPHPNAPHPNDPSPNAPHHGAADTEPEAEPAIPGGQAPAVESIADIDFDALDYSSDFTRFMAPGIPETIRRHALRALWQSNPILANLDGLNDYDEDFSDAAVAVEPLKTAYRIGKGYLTGEGEEEGESAEMPSAESKAAEKGDDRDAAGRSKTRADDAPPRDEGTDEPA